MAATVDEQHLPVQIATLLAEKERCRVGDVDHFDGLVERPAMLSGAAKEGVGDSDDIRAAGGLPAGRDRAGGGHNRGGRLRGAKHLVIGAQISVANDRDDIKFVVFTQAPDCGNNCGCRRRVGDGGVNDDEEPIPGLRAVRADIVKGVERDDVGDAELTSDGINNTVEGRRQCGRPSE